MGLARLGEARGALRGGVWSSICAARTVPSPSRSLPLVCAAAALCLPWTAACTPVAHRGEAPPWFLLPLPIEPALDAEGKLLRPTVPLTDGEAATAPAAVPGDAAIPVPLPLALRATAYAHPRLQAALEAVVQARADHITARLLPNPSLSASITLLPLPGQSFNAATRQGGPPQLDLGLAQLVDGWLFGKRDLAATAGAIEVDAALATYADAARQMLVGTAVAFHEALLAEAMVELVGQFTAQLAAMERLTAQRVALGGTGRIELDRVQLEAAAVRRELVRIQGDRDQALARFRWCLGRAEGAERARPSGSLEAVPAVTVPEFEALLALAEQHRPDLAARQRGVQRAEATSRLERRLAWPAFGVLGGYTRQYQRRAIGFPDVSSYGLGLDVTLPLFDRNQGNILKADSALRAATLELEAAALELRTEIATAVAALRTAQQIECAIGDAELQLAQRLRDSVELAYRSGGRSLIEVLDASAAYRDLRRDHLVAHAELWLALHRLDAAVGTTAWRETNLESATPPPAADHVR